MRLKKYLTILIIIIIAISVVVLWWNIYYRYIPSKPGAALSESQLKSNLNSIARRYTDSTAHCTVYGINDNNRLIKDKELKITDENQKYISFNGGEPWKRDTSPREVYALFEMYLYLENKKVPYDIIRLQWYYASIALSGEELQCARVTKIEFEELYGRVNVLGLNNEEAAKVLADKWIAETGFVKK